MITNNDTSVVDPLMQSYVQWVLNVQSENDPNNIDVRGKLKIDKFSKKKSKRSPLPPFQSSLSSIFPLELLTTVAGAGLKLMALVFVVEPTLSMPFTC